MKKDFINNTTMEESEDKEEEEAAEQKRKEIIEARNTSITNFLWAKLYPKHPTVLWILEVDEKQEIILKFKVLDRNGVSTATSLAKGKVKQINKDIADTLGIGITDFSSRLLHRADRTDQGASCLRFRTEFDKRLTSRVWRHLGQPWHDVVRAAELIGLTFAHKKSLMQKIPIELWAMFCALACEPYMLSYEEAEILASKVLESTFKALKVSWLSSSRKPKHSPVQTHRTLTQNQDSKPRVTESTYKQSTLSLLPPPIRPAPQTQDRPAPTQDSKPKVAESTYTYKQSKVSLLPPPRNSVSKIEQRPKQTQDFNYWCCIS